jgi:hypothetical protein
MATKSDDMTNGIVGLVGSLVFAVLTILVPLVKVFGGFLTYSETVEFFEQEITTKIDYYWDVVEGTLGGLSIEFNYPDYVDQSDLSAEFIWQIIPLWGLLWIILGLLGTVLVAIPAVQKLSGQEPSKIWNFGVIIGLIGTMVEYGIFIAAWLLEDWAGETQPEINLILLGCFVIGWIAIIIGAMFIRKE